MLIRHRRKCEDNSYTNKYYAIMNIKLYKCLCIYYLRDNDEKNNRNDTDYVIAEVIKMSREFFILSLEDNKRNSCALFLRRQNCTCKNKEMIMFRGNDVDLKPYLSAQPFFV